MPLGSLDFQVELSKIASLEARRRVYLHAGRHGREPGEAVQAGWPRRSNSSPLGFHGR